MHFITTQDFNMCKHHLIVKLFYRTCSPCWLFTVFVAIFFFVEISEITTSPCCHGEHFRTSTVHFRTLTCVRQTVSSPTSPFFSLKSFLRLFVWFILRLLLSGNPLDCVCENLWIKLRLQEDIDGPELTCTDERGETRDFATLTPPDCGNVKRCWFS